MRKPIDGREARLARKVSTARSGWRALSFPMRPEERAVVEEAMRLAGVLLGPGTPDWQRLEAMAVEFLKSHPDPGEGR